MAECVECGGATFRDDRCAAHVLMAERGPDGRYHRLDLDLSGAGLEDVTIRDVTFDGETHFDRGAFTGEVRFENCGFTGYVSFVGATAERLAFRDCRFGAIVNLGGTAFGELSIRRSAFDAPVKLDVGPGDVDVHLTTFARRMRVVGNPQRLELVSVACRGGAQLRVSGTDVFLQDVELGAASSLEPDGRWYDRPPRVFSLADTDVSCLTVFATDLSRCTFTRAHNLDDFGIDTLDAFARTPPGPYTRRRVLWDEGLWRSGQGRRRWRAFCDVYNREAWTDPTAIARDYRALRKAREDAKDEPGAADFYYGEMEMRRMARRAEMRQPGKRITATTEYVLLWLYWAVSGYGLRAWRALTALAVVLLAAAVLLRYAGFPGAGHTFAASLRFAIQSAMSLLRGTDVPLTPTGEWVALALRLLGPLLFGLALLALRGRVRR